MQVNLIEDERRSSGLRINTMSRENYELGQPHGWLARDHNAWFRSSTKIERLKRLFGATLIFGHDMDIGKELIQRKRYYE